MSSFYYDFEKLATANDAKTITASDTNVDCRSLYIGTAGDVEIVTPEGSTVLFVDVQGLLPVKAARITSNTTATDIVALF